MFEPYGHPMFEPHGQVTTEATDLSVEMRVLAHRPELISGNQDDAATLLCACRP